MAHRTMVDGTAYEIKGGRTLVDGTAYDVKKGKTLVGGTAYEIGFGCTVTINVRCDWKNKAYVVIDGTKYDASDSSVYRNHFCSARNYYGMLCHQ